MIVFLNLKGKQNVEGEKGVYTVSNISQSNTHTYFFFSSKLLVSVYTIISFFFIEKLKTH